MLEIKNLSSGYGKKQVLFSVDTSVEKGEFVSVIGPNGSGKSTLLKSIVGINKMLSGEVLIDGVSLTSLSERERARKVSYLQQGYFIPDMTVEETVIQGRYPYLSYPYVYGDNDRRIAYECMETTGVLPFAHLPMSELSGGMRQNVFIAMILAQGTDYILLDEPLTYLDVSHKASLMKILNKLTREGKCILSVMHDLPLAFSCSDRIAVMQNGRLKTVESPSELYSDGIVKDVFGIDMGLAGENYYIKL